MNQPRMDGGDHVPPINSEPDGYWYDKNLHKWQHDVPKMPWHSDDKPFGMTQEEWDEKNNTDGSSPHCNCDTADCPAGHADVPGD